MGAKVWKRTDQGGSQSYTVGVQQQQQTTLPSWEQHPLPQKHKFYRQNQKEGFQTQKSPKKGFKEDFHVCQVSQNEKEGCFEGVQQEDLNNSSSSSTTNDGVSAAARKTDENFNFQSSSNNFNDFNLYQKKNNGKCFQSNGKFQFERNGNQHMGTRDEIKSNQFQFKNFQRDAADLQFNSKFQPFKSNDNNNGQQQFSQNNNNSPFKPRHTIHKKGHHKFNMHAQHHFKQQQQGQQFQNNSKIQEQKQKFEGAKEEVIKIQERMKQLEDAIRQTKKRKAEQELNEHEEKKQRLRNKLQRSFAKQFEQAAEEGQVKREAEERERQRQEILQLIQKIQKANDPYEILGVDKSSVLDLDSKIRTSFKKLAVTLHPDKCSFEDSTEAFRKVRSAYDTLQNKLVS
eukprot:TRINITY_DN5448_c0_g2_i1.p1 TRINITY_DN5448_c0_g2~~TRINITY_DN5448_c0_g2_i1.p1  ORF type:complete len:450 (-),score=69.13 TRINITY_DN5448_c0_g2_i1:1684-2883(-)